MCTAGEIGAELRRYGTLRCIQLCDAHHKVLRMEEETVLLEKEMSQYIAYCRDQVISVDAMLSSFERDSWHALNFAGLPNSGRYFCQSAFQRPLAGGDPVGGVRALLMRAKAEFAQLVRDAEGIFAQPIDPAHLPSLAAAAELDEASDLSSEESDAADELEDLML